MKRQACICSLYTEKGFILFLLAKELLPFLPDRLKLGIVAHPRENEYTHTTCTPTTWTRTHSRKQTHTQANTSNHVRTHHTRSSVRKCMNTWTLAQIYAYTRKHTRACKSLDAHARTHLVIIYVKLSSLWNKGRKLITIEYADRSINLLTWV